MKTEIEEVFFKAFEQSGVVDNCIDWMREMYDLGFLPKGGLKLPEQLERYYNETLPNKIRDATEAFDDTVINSLIEEIKSNLDECQNEAQRERYLFSLLKPFKGLSDVYHPIAQINSLQVLIEDCKRHKAMWESLPRDQIPFNVAGEQSGTPKEQIEACDDMATNYQKRIDRLHYISRRFCEVIGGQINEKNSVEWCLEKFVNVWSEFANRLDALLLERTEFKPEHRSLIWLQRECGIFLKPRRCITDVDYYLGSTELARKYISEVHGVEFTEIQQVQNSQINKGSISSIFSDYLLSDIHRLCNGVQFNTSSLEKFKATINNPANNVGVITICNGEKIRVYHLIDRLAKTITKDKERDEWLNAILPCLGIKTNTYRSKYADVGKDELNDKNKTFRSALTKILTRCEM